MTGRWHIFSRFQRDPAGLFVIGDDQLTVLSYSKPPYVFCDATDYRRKPQIVKVAIVA